MDSTSTSTEPTPPPLPPSTTQPSEPPQPSSTSSATAIPTSSSTSTQNPNPNPNPNPTPQASTTPLQQQQQPQSRPQLNRARPQSTYPRPSSTSFAPSMFASPATTPTQQGGLRLAHQPRAPFSTYQQQQFGVLGRNPTKIPNPNTPTAAQVKQPSVQGIQTIGNFGSLSGSQLRPGGLSSSHNQPRPLQSTIRPQTTINQHQRFQSHGLMRGPTMNSPTSPSSSTPHVLQTHTQPWMSAPNQGKQLHPSYRQQIRPQNLQQRSQNPQQHPHPTSTVSNQQVKSSQQETPLPEVHLKEIHARQHPGTRVPQSVLPQPLAQRGVGLGNQKSPTVTTQAGVQSGPANNVDKVDAVESTTHILSKRSIRELVSQIDPSEKLDPEVEDILIEIAEDFVDSITTVGCSLAKHRKSATLEAKDILLHLEKNWNMTLPGFGGDEIKGYKKQLTNDIHKERLAAVKKAMVGADVVHVKSTGGQAAGNMKSPVAKAPIPGSPKAQEIS